MVIYSDKEKMKRKISYESKRKKERRKERGEGWEDDGKKNGSVPWFGLETLITQDHRL